jgi:hypothetical protein
VRRYAEWRDDLVSPIATIDDIRATWQYFLLDPDYDGRPVAKYLRTLAKVDRCARSLARNVRKPPGSKLAEAYELLDKACKLMRSSAASDRSAIAAKETDAFVHRADWGEAFLPYQEADEAVLAHLMFMRPLPVKRGRTGESRIEPVFSDVATRISDEHPAGPMLVEARLGPGPQGSKRVRGREDRTEPARVRGARRARTPRPRGLVRSSWRFARQGEARRQGRGRSRRS